jgi:hypothetical protein
VNLCRAHNNGYRHRLPNGASAQAAQHDNGCACQLLSGNQCGGWLAKSQVRAQQTSAGQRPSTHRPEQRRTRVHRRTPACVERSMASDPDRRSVVPPTGDTWQERSARCQRQPSQATCAPRRSPNSSRCHQRRSAAGRRRAGCPSFAPWAATDATPTPRSGPCWKPCPSYPQPANRLSDPGTADFLRARDNQGDRVTWVNARKRLLICTVG